MILEPTQSGGLRELVVTNVAMINEDSEWWRGEASCDQRGRDQRGRWPLRRVECDGLKSVARYDTCPTSVVWATDAGFIGQMDSLSPNRLVFWDEFSCLISNRKFPKESTVPK